MKLYQFVPIKIALLPILVGWYKGSKNSSLVKIPNLEQILIKESSSLNPKLNIDIVVQLRPMDMRYEVSEKMVEQTIPDNLRKSLEDQGFIMSLDWNPATHSTPGDVEDIVRGSWEVNFSKSVTIPFQYSLSDPIYKILGPRIIEAFSDVNVWVHPSEIFVIEQLIEYRHGRWLIEYRHGRWQSAEAAVLPFLPKLYYLHTQGTIEDIDAIVDIHLETKMPNIAYFMNLWKQ